MSLCWATFKDMSRLARDSEFRVPAQGWELF